MNLRIHHKQWRDVFTCGDTERCLPLGVTQNILPSLVNNAKVFQLIFSKIVKIVAIRCQILKKNCTQFDFGWVYEQRSRRPPSWS